MAEETITILRVGTEEAVKNIADLRANIKALKEGFEDAQGNMHKGLNDLEIGTQEYKDTLDELKVNQNALKDAMYATSSSMEDVAKAATGTAESYNSLVHRMAALKEEFRSTEDAARRADLGGQIKAINDQLKDMDALQGNFQRNVGNYANSIKDAFGDMSKNMDVFRKSIGAVGGGLNGLKDGMEGISKSPMIATFGLLVSIALKLADELKENETAMAAIKKAMAALQPVMDFFSGIIEKLAEYLADIISKVTQFVNSNGLMQKIISGVMGVGNAILQYIIAPFKGVIAAIKVFKEQGVKGLGDAAKAFGQEIKQGFSFKQNFQAGQAVAETFIAGAKSKKKEVKSAGKDLGKEAADGFLDGIEEQIDKDIEAAIADIEKKIEEANKAAVKKAEDRLNALDKAYDHQLELNSILVENERERAEKEYQIQAEGNKKKLGLLEQFMQDALGRNDLDAYLAFDQQRADLEVEIETNAIREKERLRKQDLKDAEKNAKAQKDLLKGVASATSSILGSIADLYEDDEENSEKNANKIKNLRIAAATIDTISGAIGAFMQASQTIPPPYGQIVGAAAAAAVTASGIAQIAKLKSTKVSGSASSNTPSTPAIASAPTLTTEVSNVRSVTSASEEDRLNQMASDQRVYIAASDIEASQNQIKTQVAESSF
jgi:CII-binding regulator of phage lambda lysogenization HflD